MIHKLKYLEEDREKTAFYASDMFKSDLDLYFSMTKEPKTNPPKWNETLKWGAGNGVEAQALKILKMNKWVNDDYDQRVHGRVDMEREGITIHGYIDAMTLKGHPIEIKSINNANTQDIKNYERGYPRESYVAQLSVYMDFLDIPVGYLFVSSIDGLHTFWLECKRIGYRKFKCGNITVDLDAEYKRLSKLYHNHIVPKVLPDLFQYVYKRPVREIDWKTIAPSAISKARTGKKVIGDWQIGWSPWKHKIIELQGSGLGYSNEELDFIREATKGYTTWPKRGTTKSSQEDESVV